MSQLLVIAFEIFEDVVALLILAALAVAIYLDRLLRRCLFDGDSNFISIFAISFFSIAISRTLTRTRSFVDLRSLLDLCSLLSGLRGLLLDLWVRGVMGF